MQYFQHSATSLSLPTWSIHTTQPEAAAPAVRVFLLQLFGRKMCLIFPFLVALSYSFNHNQPTHFHITRLKHRCSCSHCVSNTFSIELYKNALRTHISPPPSTRMCYTHKRPTRCGEDILLGKIVLILFTTFKSKRRANKPFRTRR